MSYEHRGLVIDHPVDFPTSKSDMFLLKSNDFSFISHDSLLKLNDIRTVSINRILYQQSGRIDPSSDTYREIESLVLRKFFPSFFHDYENNKKTLASLNEQVLSLTEDKTKLESEIKKLKSERDSMHNKLKSITNI